MTNKNWCFKQKRTLIWLGLVTHLESRYLGSRRIEEGSRLSSATQVQGQPVQHETLSQKYKQEKLIGATELL